jgi:hypothetical protein
MPQSIPAVNDATRSTGRCFIGLTRKIPAILVPLDCCLARTIGEFLPTDDLDTII